jgi:hypothetical protein
MVAVVTVHGGGPVLKILVVKQNIRRAHFSALPESDKSDVFLILIRVARTSPQIDTLSATRYQYV